MCEESCSVEISSTDIALCIDAVTDVSILFVLFVQKLFTRICESKYLLTSYYQSTLKFKIYLYLSKLIILLQTFRDENKKQTNYGCMKY